MPKKLQNTGSKKSLTDWARIDALADDQIDYSDNPPLGEEFWQNAVIYPYGLKSPITIRMDSSIVSWFKAKTGGRGYQTAINQVLREYVRAQKGKKVA